MELGEGSVLAGEAQGQLRSVPLFTTGRMLGQEVGVVGSWSRIWGLENQMSTSTFPELAPI